MLKIILSLFNFLLFLSSLVPLGLWGQSTFRDNFSSVSYSNNNGSLNFSAAWDENNDDNDPANGRIEINNNQLRFSNLDGAQIGRTLNLLGASSVTLTLDYNRTNGNERVDVQLWNGSFFNTVATLSGTGSISYTLATNEISANSEIRFESGSGGWSSSETVYVDNVLFTADFSPNIAIDDLTVNENDGSAIFTVTLLQDVPGGFTVDYSTSDGTAIAGSDYTATSGTLSFAGTNGETHTVSVVLVNDNVPEVSDETFTVNLSNISNPGVVIADGTGEATIIDDEYLFNTPLVLKEEFDGYVDYSTTGGSLRTLDNGTDPCAITTSSSNSLTSAVPATATIEKAILYWAHSGATPDTQVSFDGNTINAEFLYGTSLGSRTYYEGISDVTSIVTATPSLSTHNFTFTGLTIDNTGGYCGTTVVGGWTLMVFYSDPSLPASTINVYAGFSAEQNSSSSYSLGGFFAIGASGAKTTVLSWEGDQDLNNNELLSVTTGLGTFTLAGDGDNDGISTNNPFNSTIFDNTSIPVVNNATSYGLDLDTYDVSPYVTPGESSITTKVQCGQDYVIVNAVVLKVPSNLVAGTVFEDINYGGGAGRNLAAASGVPVEGTTVELYDSGGTLVETTSTSSNGKYVFGGMANGTYSIRAVNNTVRSTRSGGSACTSCEPVQTYKTDFLSGALVEDFNSVGGANPAAADPGPGNLTGAQSVSSMSIFNQGVAGMDFGFNFNTIVNANDTGQGSLDQFIINSNALDASGIDIEANALFDPASGEDVSIFMIPPTGDALGRTADANYTAGYFDIAIPNNKSLSIITNANTHIDGRTQTAYSGDTNAGSVGAGGTTVGISGSILPSYDRPEIQVHSVDGDVFTNQGSGTVIRNLAVFADDNAGFLLTDGSVTITQNLIGVNALGANSGNILYGLRITGVSNTISGNYIATNTEAGLLVSGGTTTLIENNHFYSNGNNSCSDNLNLVSGSGIAIRQNLIENAASLGIDADGIPGNIMVTENTITASGQDGGKCTGKTEMAGILLDGNNSSITSNIIYGNGGAGIVVAGGNSSGNIISQNSIYGNGTTEDALGIDIDLADGCGDGVTLNDSADTDNGPNGALNFPIISSAYMSGANLIVKGWSRPGATIEIFLTDIEEGTAAIGDNQLGMSLDYGEGQTYLGSLVEGSGSDFAAGTSSYTDADGNTDNTNLFELQIPVPPGIAVGQKLTATATSANSTSEFSPFGVISVRSVLTNRRITYRVNGD